MNKIIICFVALLVFSSSCKKDLLDITPDGRLELQDIFSDEKRTEAYLNTVYSSIPKYFWRYNGMSFLAGITDEAKDADVGVILVSGTSILQWNSGSLTVSTNPLVELNYSGWWTGIRNANIFLENIDKANVSDPANKNRLKAEAQVLRAFYYLELIKQFGAMPVIDKSFTPSFDYTTLKRPTFQENVDFIVKDCDAALANKDFPIRLTLNGDRGRFTKAVAYAIKSQALLYNASPLWNPGQNVAKWQAAAASAKTALTALTANNEYSLTPFNGYVDYFINGADLVNNPKDKETIFEITDISEGNYLNFNTLPSKGGLKAGTTPSQELVDSYEMQATGKVPILGYSDVDHLLPIIDPLSGYDPGNPYSGRDPRFYASIWHNGAVYDNIAGAKRPLEIYVGGREQIARITPIRKNTPTGYYMRKFIDSKLPVTQPQSARWKKFRLAELYLNFAEAENEALAAPSFEVYNMINAIRLRAQMPVLPPGLTKEQMRERIRRERRVELAFEEHRFWDVRRWKILDQTDKLVTGMEIKKSSTTNGLSYTRFVAERRYAWDPKFLIFPIPISDASIIPDFSANQNPGW